MQNEEHFLTYNFEIMHAQIKATNYGCAALVCNSTWFRLSVWENTDQVSPTEAKIIEDRPRQ